MIRGVRVYSLGFKAGGILGSRGTVQGLSVHGLTENGSDVDSQYLEPDPQQLGKKNRQVDSVHYGMCSLRRLLLQLVGCCYFRSMCSCLFALTGHCGEFDVAIKALLLAAIASASDARKAFGESVNLLPATPALQTRQLQAMGSCRAYREVG